MSIPRPAQIAVVGGGISGLAAAHRLLELARERSLPLQLQLMERSDRLGGVILTERRDGFLLEGGPESFITDKPWALALCRRLGLEGELIGTNDAFRRSFVAWRGRLHPIPEGFQVLAPSRLRAMAASPLFTWRGKLRMALELRVPARRDGGDESLGHFVERRLGREALERMAEPLIAGIYGADPHELSLAATLPRFQAMEQEHGSLIRALRARRLQQREAGVSGARYGLFVTLRDGMQTLVDTLAARLPPGAVRLGAEVVAVSTRALPQGSGAGFPACGPRDPEPRRLESPRHSLAPLPPGSPQWTVTLADGSELAADAVCLALPAYAAGQLLQPLDGELAELLAGIPHGSSATVNLAFEREEVSHPLAGFGFVVPAVERRALLGCTFSSVKFPGRAPEGKALLRAFLGAAEAELEEAEAVAAVRDDLRRYLGIAAAPLWTTFHRWPRAMPRYPVGHLDRVAQIEARAAAHLRLALAGNAYRGIGLPDAIHSGEQAAERIVEQLISQHHFGGY